MSAENPGEDPHRRSLLLALDEWNDYLRRLPMTDPKRNDAARRIVKLEDELTASEGL